MASLSDQAQASGLSKAVVISGAGVQDANGTYRATPKEYCDAPTYEHVERGAEFKITREPHTNAKTGAVKHGWLLGQNCKPLYGAPTESLEVPSAGWKKFGGDDPVPTVKVQQLEDLLFAMADDSKSAADAALECEDWALAVQHCTAGIDALKRSGGRFCDAFKNRAALILSRRASAHLRLKDFKAALRDAVASLELGAPGLSSAEAVALEAARELGCKDDSLAQKILEPVGTGRILDPGAPLVLRCVERWVAEVVPLFSSAEEGQLQVPVVTHMPSDRYLDGLDEEARQAVIKQYLPELPFGGTGIISNPKDCLTVMDKWEEVFTSQEFQAKRKALWARRDLSYPLRLKETRTMVAESLAVVLEPMGFAPG
ncbi:unnamed protein product, partial [Polarella glacialis]